jgi:hypothetical protein
MIEIARKQGSSPQLNGRPNSLCWLSKVAGPFTTNLCTLPALGEVAFTIRAEGNLRNKDNGPLHGVAQAAAAHNPSI